MGDVLQPQPVPTRRNRADDAFSNALRFYMGGGGSGGIPGANGDTITVRGAGGVGVPINVGGDGGFGGFGAGPGGGLPPTFGEFISQFNLPEYGGTLSSPMTGIQTAAQGFGADALTEYFRSGGIFDTISNRLLQEFNETGSASGMDLDQVYAALDAQRRQGLTRDLGQLEEEFGVQGLSDSTALYESAARRQTESEQNLLGEVARIAPQLAEVDLRRNSQLGELATLLSGLPLGVAQAGFNLGEGARSIGQQDLDRMYNEFIRQSSLIPQIISYFAGTPPPAYAPSPLSQFTNLGLTGLTGYDIIRG